MPSLPRLRLPLPRTLRARLAVLVACALLPAVVLTLVAGAARGREAERAARERALQVARGAQLHLAELVGGTRQFLEATAREPHLLGARAECDTRLAALLALQPQYGNLVVADAVGRVRCSGLPAARAPLRLDRARDLALIGRALATQRFTVGGFEVGRFSGRPIVPMLVALRGDPERRVLGVSVDMAWLARTAAADALPPDAILAVVDADGRIVGHASGERRWVGGRVRLDVLARDDADGDPRLTLAPDGDGRGRLWVTLPLRALRDAAPLSLVVGLPDAPMRAARSSLLRAIAWTLGIVALVLGLTWRLGERLVVVPAERLARVAARIAAGDPTARTGLAHDDTEIGRVADAFDRMAEALAARAVEAEASAAALRASEERLTLALEAIEEGVWDWDLVTDHVEYSPRCFRLLGFAPGALANDAAAWQARVHPDDAPALHAAIAAHLDGTAPRFDHEFRARHADGGWRWLQSRGQIVARAADGTPLRMLGTDIDVTARREAVERQRTLAALVEGADDFYGIAAPDGRLTYVNPAGLALLGVAGREIPDGLGIVGLIASDDRPHVLLRLATDLAAAGVWHGEFALQRADGAPPIPVRASAHVVHDPDGGRALARAVVLRDLRADRRQQAERGALEAQLRHAQKMEAVGQLAGGIAHDFNNLLTVIRGNLGFVRADLPAEHPVQPDLAEIAHASESATGLVKQLLAFSRKQPSHPRDVEPDAVVRDASRLLVRALGERHALDLALQTGAVRVRVDPQQLEQILLNLVVNARDAMPDGGVVTIETGVRRADAPAPSGRVRQRWGTCPEGPHVVLAVHDVGEGIAPERLAHVVEPFYTTKEVGRGTGLGLAVVYGVAMQAGGALEVESASGAGTTVRLLLPLSDRPAWESVGHVEDAGDAGVGDVGADAVGDASSAGAATAGGAHDAPAAPSSDPLVLLVEDERLVRATLRRTLERGGYRVLEARHGADALLLWRAHRDEVALVLSDVRMPELDGAALAHQLRLEAPALPILLLSGYTDAAAVERHAADGAVLEKPVPPDVLLAAVHDALAARV